MAFLKVKKESVFAHKLCGGSLRLTAGSLDNKSQCGMKGAGKSMAYNILTILARIF
jgi:hypothetical protein